MEKYREDPNENQTKLAESDAQAKPLVNSVLYMCASCICLSVYNYSSTPS